MHQIILLAAALSAQPGAPGAPVPHRILLDGRFEDWRGVPLAVGDAADAPDAAVDFRELRVAHEGKLIHFMLDLGRSVNLQALSGGTIELLLDIDADAATGQTVREMPGVDAIIEFTAEDPKGGSRKGLGVVVPAPAPGAPAILGAATVGLAHEPTYADRRTEIRVERGATLPGGAEFLTAPRFKGRFDFVDGKGAILDSIGPFTYEPGPVVVTPSPDQNADPLARLTPAPLRVVTWNVRRGHIIDDPEPFGRILTAVDPDIVLLQELMAPTTVQQLAGVLDQWVTRRGAAHWNVVVGTGGTELHCAVASRLPLRTYTALEPVPYPDQPDRAVRIAAAQVDHPLGPIVAISVHLTCCGHAGSFEDRTRQIEADALARAMAAAFAKDKPERIVVAGDFNLVGSRRPLELLTVSADADGHDLAVVDAYQLNGLADATWSDSATPFGPGRLDFVLFSDTSLALERAIVLDSSEVASQWLTRHGVRPGDTGTASDHWPVVVDLRRKGGRR